MICFLIALTVFAAPQTGRRSQPVDLRMHGYWGGTISLGGEPHEITLAFSSRESPALTLARRKLDGLIPLKPSALEYTPTTFKAAFKRLGIEILGNLRPGAATLDIVVTGSGAAQRVALARVDSPGRLRRPQTPVPPLPYDTYDDRIDTGNGILGTTLTMPRGRGPFPGVVLLSGTGSQDRDNSMSAHRPFAVIADHLTRRGFAVLRFDDRGSGVSSGLFDELRTVESDAFDAIAAFRYLREHPEVDRARTGFIGHSEGGIVAPLAAGQTEGVGFLVLLGSPAVDMIETALTQHESIARARGATEARIAFERRVRSRIYGILRVETDAARAREAVAAVFRETTIEAGVADLDWIIELKQAVDVLMAKAWSTTFRQRLLADPKPALRALRVPALALFGSLDVQVVAAVNEPVMRDALSASSPLTEVRTLPGLNHAFQTAKTGSVDEYWQIEETFAPSALEVMGLWLTRVTAR